MKQFKVLGAVCKVKTDLTETKVALAGGNVIGEIFMEIVLKHFSIPKGYKRCQLQLTSKPRGESIPVFVKWDMFTKDAPMICVSLSKGSEYFTGDFGPTAGKAIIKEYKLKPFEHAPVVMHLSVLYW